MDKSLLNRVTLRGKLCKLFAISFPFWASMGHFLPNFLPFMRAEERTGNRPLDNFLFVDGVLFVACLG